LKTTRVILAGGKSSRYHRLRHKFLDLYEGKEIILHVVESLEPMVDEMVIVTAPDNYEVKKILQDYEIVYVVQDEPLGTGHALLCATSLFEGKDTVLLVCYADKPLITRNTLSVLLKEHRESDAEVTVAVTNLPEPGSKGRIIRENGKFFDIIEAKDAGEEILKIKEVNTGFLVCFAGTIYDKLKKLGNNNVKKEYYLTKVYREFIKDGFFVHTVKIPPLENFDVNTVLQLDNIEEWISKINDYENSF